MKNDEKLVVLRRYESDVAANIDLGVLRTHGIPCVLNNEIMSSVWGMPFAPFDNIRLLVREQDVALARRILENP